MYVLFALYILYAKIFDAHNLGLQIGFKFITNEEEETNTDAPPRLQSRKRRKRNVQQVRNNLYT